YTISGQGFPPAGPSTGSGRAGLSGGTSLERLYRVRTPEMVDFSFPVAGLGSRFLAYLIDTVLIAGTGFGVMSCLFFMAGISSMASPFLGMAFVSFGFLVFLFLQWGYFVVWEAVRDGRTPGKRLLGLRTIGERGVRITLAQS